MENVGSKPDSKNRYDSVIATITLVISLFGLIIAIESSSLAAELRSLLIVAFFILIIIFAVVIVFNPVKMFVSHQRIKNRNAKYGREAVTKVLKLVDRFDEVISVGRPDTLSYQIDQLRSRNVNFPLLQPMVDVRMLTYYLRPLMTQARTYEGYSNSIMLFAQIVSINEKDLIRNVTVLQQTYFQEIPPDFRKEFEIARTRYNEFAREYARTIQEQWNRFSNAGYNFHLDEIRPL